MSCFVEVQRNISLYQLMKRINDMGLGTCVFQWIPHVGKTTVIFKFDDYPAYQWFCHKTKRTPVSTEEFFPLCKPEEL